jgi:uncharacterized protein (DUF1800 family)
LKGFQLLKPISNWDSDAARHILSRTIFGFTQQDVAFALSLTLDEFIENYLLVDLPEPNPPAVWVTETPVSNNTKVDKQRLTELVYWWFGLMRNQNYSLRERMTLFWHNHFVSEFSDVKYPQFMYLQNRLFREYAFGNIINLTKTITIDPAMLRYLDGRKNTKKKLNENYARELMELFTMGIGNYTEQDIGEVARALTGWKIVGINAVFDESRYDPGIKNCLGESGNFNHEHIVDIIFSKEATARFLSTKLYQEFIFYEPNLEYIQVLAQVMSDNNYELKPVLSTLLQSTYFHSPEIRAAKIKSPIEFIISALQQFSILNSDYEYLKNIAVDLQQELFGPPDVRGWEGQRKWISTNTYPYRNRFTDLLIDGKDYNNKNIDFKVDVLEYARRFTSSEYTDVIKAKADVSTNIITYPNTNLGAQLSIVANLISGGLGTPIDLISIKGFDTHSSPVNRHKSLLKIVADAVAAFQNDLFTIVSYEQKFINNFSVFNESF